MWAVHISSVMYKSAGLLFLTRRVTGDENNKVYCSVQKGSWFRAKSGFDCHHDRFS